MRGLSERKSKTASSAPRVAGGTAAKRSSRGGLRSEACAPSGTLIAGVQLLLCDFLAGHEIVEVGVRKLDRFLGRKFVPVCVNQRVGVGQQLVALVTVRKHAELLHAVRVAQQPVLGAIQQLQHRRLERVAEDDLVVVVVAARNDFAVPLDLQRAILRTTARSLGRVVLARAVVAAVAEVVRLPDLDGVDARLPEFAERAGVGGVLLKL